MSSVASSGTIKLIRGFTPKMITLIKQTGDDVFGNLPIVNHRTGMKLLKQKPTGPLAINHYPIDSTRQFKSVSPEFTTELEERRLEKARRLRKEGKGKMIFD